MNSFSLFFINVFIVSYFSIAFLWLWATNLITIKHENSQSRTIIHSLSAITSLIGLEQNWGLFSPNVRSDNNYGLVVIVLQNGFLKLFEMPRMEKLNVLEKAQREKFRKIFNDNFPYPSFRHMRPAFSRFLAKVAYSKYNPPARMSYFLVSDPIPPPEASTVKIPQKESNLHPAIINYFVYGVSPDDFQ